MKRIVLAVLVLALVLPAHAAAAKRSYSGAFDAVQGSIDFTLKKKGTKKRKKTSVRGFTFLEVPITCDTGSATTSGRLTFGMRVAKKRFSADADDDQGSSLHVEGTLKQKGKRVVGTLRVFGSVPLDPDGQIRGTNCDTGVLEWSAARA